MGSGEQGRFPGMKSEWVEVKRSRLANLERDASNLRFYHDEVFPTLPGWDLHGTETPLIYFEQLAYTFRGIADPDALMESVEEVVSVWDCGDGGAGMVENVGACIDVLRAMLADRTSEQVESDG